MLIPIYYGKRITFTIVMDRRAEIVCTTCKNGFCVTDKVGAVGEAFSVLGLQNTSASEKALKTATKNLGTSISNLSPVPCPYCGKFQPAMKHYLSWIKGQKVLFAVMILMILIGTGSLVHLVKTKGVGGSDLTVLIGAASAAVAFLVYRFFKDLRLQPTEVEKIATEPGTPPLRIGLRNNKDAEWMWLDV